MKACTVRPAPAIRREGFGDNRVNHMKGLEAAESGNSAHSHSTRDWLHTHYQPVTPSYQCSHLRANAVDFHVTSTQPALAEVPLQVSKEQKTDICDEKLARDNADHC